MVLCLSISLNLQSGLLKGSPKTITLQIHTFPCATSLRPRSSLRPWVSSPPVGLQKLVGWCHDAIRVCGTDDEVCR